MIGWTDTRSLAAKQRMASIGLYRYDAVVNALTKPDNVRPYIATLHLVSTTAAQRKSNVNGRGIHTTAAHATGELNDVSMVKEDSGLRDNRPFMVVSIAAMQPPLEILTMHMATRSSILATGVNVKSLVPISTPSSSIILCTRKLRELC